MEKIKVNNQVVSMRKYVKQAKTRVINKCTKQIKFLEHRKGSEEQMAKNKRKMERLLSEINILKKIHPDSVSKLALAKEKDWKAVLAEKNVPLEDRCFAMLANHAPVEEAVENFHNTNSEIVPKIAMLLKDWEVKRQRSAQITPKKFKDKQLIDKNSKIPSIGNKKKHQNDNKQVKDSATDSNKPETDSESKSAEDLEKLQNIRSRLLSIAMPNSKDQQDLDETVYDSTTGSAQKIVTDVKSRGNKHLKPASISKKKSKGKQINSKTVEIDSVRNNFTGETSENENALKKKKRKLRSLLNDSGHSESQTKQLQHNKSATERSESGTRSEPESDQESSQNEISKSQVKDNESESGSELKSDRGSLQDEIAESQMKQVQHKESATKNDVSESEPESVQENSENEASMECKPSILLSTPPTFTYKPDPKNKLKEVALLNLNELQDVDEIPIHSSDGDESDEEKKETIEDSGKRKKDSFFLRDGEVPSESDDNEDDEGESCTQQESSSFKTKFSNFNKRDSKGKELFHKKFETDFSHGHKGSFRENNFQRNKKESFLRNGNNNFKKNSSQNYEFIPNKRFKSETNDRFRSRPDFKSFGNSPKERSFDYKGFNKNPKTRSFDSKGFNKDLKESYSSRNQHKNSKSSFSSRHSLSNSNKKDKNDDKPLHPSWEAKKKLKEAASSKFQGKRIVFGD